MPADEELQLVWSDLYPGLRVRFVTPSFVKRGTIQFIKRRSMTVLFDGHARPTPIPDAKQYFVDWKLGRTDYQLVPIAGKGPEPVLDTLTGMYTAPDADAEWIDVATAANILGTDAKNVRRKLRAGSIQGRMTGGRWEVNRESLKSP